MDKQLELISNYAASLSYDDLPASAIQAVKHKFIDTLGCVLGVYTWEPSKLVRKMCFPMETGLTARVIGSLQRTTPEMAAFANATAARTADYNDSYRIKRATHTSDAIPGVLATAEAVHADGKSLITALALTYEMGVSFSETVATMKDWNPDPCALAAVLGSAMGSGKILGLNKEQFANCASLAIVPNINVGARLTGEHSMFKEVYAGVAARQGVFSALMAQIGITGPEQAIEGENGLKTVVENENTEFGPFGGKGNQFAVERAIIKEFPARDALQISIKTAQGIREKVPVSEIESIHLWTLGSPARVAKTLPEVWAPKTSETADHSLPFLVAAGLVDGDVTVESYTRERFKDADILEVIKKLSIDEDPEFSKQAPHVFSCRIEAKTKSGETHTVQKSDTLDELRQHWTDETISTKYRSLVRYLLTPAQTEESLALMFDLEKVDDVTKIVDLLHI
jgi:2-methylcitrate dehydratase